MCPIPLKVYGRRSKEYGATVRFDLFTLSDDVPVMLTWCRPPVTIWDKCAMRFCLFTYFALTALDTMLLSHSERGRRQRRFLSLSSGKREAREPVERTRVDTWLSALTRRTPGLVDLAMMNLFTRADIWECCWRNLLLHELLRSALRPAPNKLQTQGFLRRAPAHWS